MNKSFAKLLYPISAIIGLVIAFSSLFLGRKFCGYICPFGTIQEGLGKIKKNKPKYSFMKYLSLLKYPIFLLTVYFAYSLTLYHTISFCPVYSIAHIQMIKIWGVLVLSTIFIVSIFIDRFFCRVLCPYAALMNIIQYIGNILKIPRYKINRKNSVCKKCDLCIVNCPMGIKVSKFEIISDPECIHCGKCINACPIKDGLNEKFVIRNFDK